MMACPASSKRFLFASSRSHSQLRQSFNSNFYYRRRSIRIPSSSSSVKIVEVGPRDGLQNEPNVPSTAGKIELIQRLHQAGCRHIEVGSMVSPKWVPAMADSVDVLRGLRPWKNSLPPTDLENLTLSCLVPNLHGLQQVSPFTDVVDEIAIFVSASEAFSQRNIACSIDESFERFQKVVKAAKEMNSSGNPNHPLLIRGYVSCVIACPYEGPVDPAQVAHVATRLAELGCYEVSLGDTIGVGTPSTVDAMLKEVQQVFRHSPTTLAAHFHDTYGQALANLLVSLERGITTIDSSVAGLGGCPYASGASGNVATEDVVYMLNGLGVRTDIDIEKVVDAAEFICTLLEQPSRSRAGKAIAAKRANG